MLAPNPALIQELVTSFLRSWSTATSATIAVQTTAVFPPEPLPSWYTSVDTTMAALKRAAADWSEKTGPNVFAGVPQALIDYGDLFAPAAAGMAAASTDDILKVLAQLRALAVTGRQNTSSLESALSTFVTTMQAAKAAVDAEIGNAMNTISADQTEAKALADRINTILAQISGTSADAANSQKSAYSSSASLVGSAMYFSIAMALETGPASPIVGIAIAAIGITYAAIQAAIEQNKIIEDLKEITTLQTQLAAEQQQILALQAIVNSLRALDVALEALSDTTTLVPVWDDVIEGIDAVTGQIGNGVPPAMLTEFATLAAASTAWQSAVTMATNIQMTITDFQLGPQITLSAPQPV